MSTPLTIAGLLTDKHEACAQAFHSVSFALDKMESTGLNAIGVLAYDQLVGIFTQSDFVKRVLRRNLNPDSTALNSVMTLDPLIIWPTCSIREAFSIITKHGISHLPVIDREHYCGIVTENDLRNEISALMERTTNDFRALLSYIHGESYGMCAVA